jgi:hypothetical protein
MSFEASSTRSRAPEFQNVVPSGLRRAAGLAFAQSRCCGSLDPPFVFTRSKING